MNLAPRGIPKHFLRWEGLRNRDLPREIERGGGLDGDVTSDSGSGTRWQHVRRIGLSEIFDRKMRTQGYHHQIDYYLYRIQNSAEQKKV